jgi:transposase
MVFWLEVICTFDENRFVMIQEYFKRKGSKG